MSKYLQRATLQDNVSLFLCSFVVVILLYTVIVSENLAKYFQASLASEGHQTCIHVEAKFCSARVLLHETLDKFLADHCRCQFVSKQYNLVPVKAGR